MRISSNSIKGDVFQHSCSGVGKVQCAVTHPLTGCVPLSLPVLAIYRFGNNFRARCHTAQGHQTHSTPFPNDFYNQSVSISSSSAISALNSHLRRPSASMWGGLPGCQTLQFKVSRQLKFLVLTTDKSQLIFLSCHEDFPHGSQQRTRVFGASVSSCSPAGACMRAG